MMTVVLVLLAGAVAVALGWGPMLDRGRRGHWTFKAERGPRMWR